MSNKKYNRNQEKDMGNKFFDKSEAINTGNLLQLAVEQNTSALLITDLKGNIKYVNPRFTELTGYLPEEIIEENPKLLSSGEKTEEEYKELWQTILSGKEWRGEFRNKKKNGELYWVYAVITPIRDESRRITHFLGITEDITEKKMRNDAIKATEEKYHELIENSAFAVLISDYNGNFKLLNAEACRMLGYTAEELKYLNFIDTYTDDEVHDFTDNLEIIRNAGVHVYERKMKRRDGTLFPAELTIRLTRENDFQAVIKDLSFQKEAEEKIRLQATLLDQVGQAVLATDMNGIIIYLNKAAEDLYNLNEDECLGKNIRVVFPSESFKEIDGKITAEIYQGNVWKNEFSIEREDNTMLTTFLTVNPIYDSKGNIIGKVGISFDLSEQKKKEMELIEAKQKAEEMNRLKSIFLNNMSHELRTPLVGIMGFADLLKQEQMETHQKEMISDIFDSGSRLLSTLNLLLNFSKIETGRIEIRPSEINLHSLLKENIAIYKGITRGKKLSILLEAPPCELNIRCDRKILNSVLTSLLNNAVKFTAEGSIIVSLYKEILGTSEYAVISVKDTGIGISPEDQNKIFEEFRQVTEGANRPFEGTGLGLTLTKKYLTLINGFISLKSVAGEGSTFYVYLPLECSADQSGNRRETDPSDQTEALNPDEYRILMLDDDKNVIKITKIYLEEFSKIDFTRNVQSALVLAEKNSYDLILTDINLGDTVDGLYFTKILRNIPKYKETPIIAVTAYALPEDEAEFISNGCTDFISKPFSKNQLQSKIRENLTKKRNSNYKDV